MAKEKNEVIVSSGLAATGIDPEIANLPAEITAGDWGAIEELETTDLLVPKIYHQQALSQFVKEEKAKAGDWCDSLTGQVLAKRDETLEVIIFAMFKTMLISKYDGYDGKFKLEKTVQITPDIAREMANKPFTETIDGIEYKNILTYNFYCLIPSAINGLPFVLTMNSTKTKTARKIATWIFELSQQRKASAAIIFELKSVLEQKDKNSWYGADVSQGRFTTAPEMMRAHAWYLKSKSQKFTVVEEEIAEQHNNVVSEDVPF